MVVVDVVVVDVVVVDAVVDVLDWISLVSLTVFAVVEFTICEAISCWMRIIFSRRSLLMAALLAAL